MSKQKDRYRRYGDLKSEDNGYMPIFYQAWWLDLVAGDQWDVVLEESNEEIQGIWPMTKQHKGFLTYLGSAPFTPYLGPWVLVDSTSSEKTVSTYRKYRKIVQSLLDVSSNYRMQKLYLHPDTPSWVPMYEAGYTIGQRLTYRLSLRQTLEDIRLGYDSSIRNHINVAHSQVTLGKTLDLEAFMHCQRQSIGETPEFLWLRSAMGQQWLQTILDRDVATIYATFHQDTIVATALIVRDTRYSYLLMIGSDGNAGIRGLHQILIDYCIEQEHRKSTYFDFEGSMIPSVETHFRNYGGEQVSYTTLTKIPWWIDAAHLILKRRRW